MAELFVNQAKQYAETRPSYPQELFQFIASKTPTHDLVYDVGTGSGQAARSVEESKQKRKQGGEAYLAVRVFKDVLGDAGKGLDNWTIDGGVTGEDGGGGKFLG
ncbi:hypothetical protein OIU84_026522 [Salix udensis]|uniref:Uncharacterized protein n=1 Tax=Salix udensis TaxID=889485 RepID=A0AAD6KP09_9ROSI|nr:hypothetical protein OIU84_026522 [Salix udensis]